MIQEKVESRVGTRLPNNYALVLQHRWEYDLHGHVEKQVVLCSMLNDTEYVTWRIDQEGNAYWGHYFNGNLTYGHDKAEAFRKAVDDYLTR